MLPSKVAIERKHMHHSLFRGFIVDSDHFRCSSKHFLLAHMPWENEKHGEVMILAVERSRLALMGNFTVDHKIGREEPTTKI